jgi:hypothetical protein
MFFEKSGRNKVSIREYHSRILKHKGKLLRSFLLSNSKKPTLNRWIFPKNRSHPILSSFFSMLFLIMFTNRLITSSRPILSILILLAILFSPKNLFAQVPLKPVAAWLETCRPWADFKQTALFERFPERSDLPAAVGKASVMRMDPGSVAALLQSAPKTLLFSIPTVEGEQLDLELAQVEILNPDFKLSTDSLDNIPHEAAIHYRGILRGDPNSVACLSISSSGVMGMMSDETGTYELGKLEDGSENYVFYKTAQISALSPNHCFSEEESLMGDDGNTPPASDRGVGCKTVQVYFECDYKLYTDKGSNTTTLTNYVTGLFNQIATLYANENVGIVISQIYVWTSSDPYVGYTNTSAVLNAFRQTRGSTFNGNLAHLLSTRSLGGGIAYVDVLCVKPYAFGVSAITSSYQNVPVYSWSVEVVTHELGHNLGAWHTHSCNWPTGALDNCVSPEGSCPPGPAPVNGGTIMSYCHLTGNGINFNNGFGKAPGDRIRNKVLNASCVPQSGVIPSGLTTTNITSTSCTLSWLPVPGATHYTLQYKLTSAGNWTTAGPSTAPTFNLTNLTAASAYQWQVKTDCSNYSATSSFTTESSGGGSNCNTPTGLSAQNITANSTKLVWNNVPGASSYTVQYKKNSSGSWINAGNTAAATLTLLNLTAATPYTWQVKANCSSWSASAYFTTPTAGGGNTCDAPINLNNNSIGSTYAAISWSPVTGATSYTLQIKMANSNDWFTLGSVNVTNVVISGLQSSTSYNWRVKANCSDYSTAKFLTTTGNLTDGGTENISQPVLQESIETTLFEVYPNPASHVINLDFKGDLSQEHLISIVNSVGILVREQNLEPNIDLAIFEPGVYFIRLIENGKIIAIQRFVKI